jgi:F-type H+-transporting ATPase subunit b
LRRAETFRLRAEDAVATYEKAIADVRAKAAEEVGTAREQAAADSAERNAQLGQRLAAEINAAEERIHRAREAAISGLRDVAITVSGAAVERLVGQRVEPKALASAVDAALGARRR